MIQYCSGILNVPNCRARVPDPHVAAPTADHEELIVVNPTAAEKPYSILQTELNVEP
jgi:hypothetical protein